MEPFKIHITQSKLEGYYLKHQNCTTFELYLFKKVLSMKKSTSLVSLKKTITFY